MKHNEELRGSPVAVWRGGGYRPIRSWETARPAIRPGARGNRMDRPTIACYSQWED
jgi:hypothetical protein